MKVAQLIEYLKAFEPNEDVMLETVADKKWYHAVSVVRNERFDCVVISNWHYVMPAGGPEEG